MKYEIISNSEMTSLVIAVNKYLRDGWELQGGIAVTAARHYSEERPKTHFYQAVTKKAERQK